MNNSSIRQDPAFPAMTMDILDNMLSRSDNPGQLARYLTEEIRELTGARCVLLIQCLENTHAVMDVNPARLDKWAESPEMQILYGAIHGLTKAQLWDTTVPCEASELLLKNGFDLSIMVPLRVGLTHVGAMLLLGLPDAQHLQSEIELLNTLSKVLALVLRNALLYGDQEKAIAHRTKELMLYGFSMDNMEDAVYWVNPDSSFKKINSSACKMLEYSREELCTLSLTDICPEFSEKNWPKHWDDLKQGGTINFETIFQTKTGRHIPVDISANYFEFDGKAYKCAVARDISERKRLESSLQQAQKMEAIGTLAGGIAHDFNNILSPIIGFTEMLQEDLPPNSLEQESITQILQAALRAKDLVKQILTFSRHNDQELKPVKLQSILKEALKLLRSSIPKTIDIQTDIDPQCGVVIADTTQIHQIIMNLATNAYHAMQESGGTLKVSLKQKYIESNPIGFSELRFGEYVLLKVIDTGTGIEKGAMNKIFNPYFTTKEKERGTGLGLSVVQGIVKTCNGYIHVYSEPGKGTEVHIYLPIMEKTAHDTPHELIEPVQGGTERILLVDDEQGIVRMIQQMLERLGYQVTSHTKSPQALGVFKENPDKFDLIISDMTMPKMTGLQLANEIKRVRSDIPIIICTGFSDQIHGDTYNELGIQGYLTKPVIKREMAQAIREALNGTSKMDS